MIIPEAIKIARQKRSSWRFKYPMDQRRWIVFYRKDVFKDEEDLWGECMALGISLTVKNNVFATVYYNAMQKTWYLHYLKGKPFPGANSGYKKLKDVWAEILAAYL